jgi:hypothetical protein
LTFAQPDAVPAKAKSDFSDLAIQGFGATVISRQLEIPASIGLAELR